MTILFPNLLSSNKAQKDSVSTIDALAVSSNNDKYTIDTNSYVVNDTINNKAVVIDQSG